MESSFYELSSSTTLQVIESGSPTILYPTLIFLHFWGGSAQSFSSVVSSLSSSYHTLSISFRGWGLSTGPDSPSAYSIQDLASDVEALIQKLSVTEFVLIGHSMGGKVAQLIAGRKHILGLQALILIASAPPTALVLPEDMRIQQQEAYNTAESAEFVVRNVLSSTPLSDQVVKSLVGDMLKGNKFAKLAWPEYAMSENILKEAKQIEVATLLIAGEKDRVEPIERLRSEVLGNITTGEMVIVESAGHLLPVEAASPVAAYIREFLDRKIRNM